MQALQKIERCISLQSYNMIANYMGSTSLTARLTQPRLLRCLNPRRKMSNNDAGGSEESDHHKGGSVISKIPKSLETDYGGHTNAYSPDYVSSMFLKVEGDMPVSDMTDPFTRDPKKCFLCKHNIQLDHKNVRLLSQFVSPYTGRIYGRAITGLCIEKQKQVARYIKRARVTGYMPSIIKDPKYFSDPAPYDPMRR